MSRATLMINALALAVLIYSFFKDRSKTRQGLRIAYRTIGRLLPMMVGILLVVALIMGFIDKQFISSWLGSARNGWNVVIAALLGSVLMIPSIVGFPLAASLLLKGASMTAIATFITTLTMIGVVTLPLEIKEMGRHFALLRNGLSLIIAVVIGLLIGALL